MVYSKNIRKSKLRRAFALCCAIVLAFAVTLAAATAFSEAVDPVVEAEVLQFDWTPILTAVISFFSALVSAVLAYVWKRWILPWLELRNLEEQAYIVVQAVEALMGRYNGEEKWNLALEKMKDRGFYVDSQVVIDALNAAWLNLNLEQIVAGIKPPNSPPEE